MATKTITDATFNETLSQDSKTAVVDFWADWCGPCKMLAPTLESLSSRYAEKLSVYKLNTDENPATAESFHITSIPCCIVFKNGKEVHRIIGHKSEDAFDAELAPYL